MRVSIRSMLAVAVLLTMFSGRSAAMGTTGDAPIDPFDYAYCGGKPVYPVIGFNFSTACGPRNQIALGRRGKLMWSFAGADGASIAHRGARHLTVDQLARLTLLAEVVQLADPPPAAFGPVMYDLGVDFQGRPYKRVHAAVSEAYTPANALFRELLALVPDAPLLPTCQGATRDFRPAPVPAGRTAASILNRTAGHEQN